MDGITNNQKMDCIYDDESFEDSDEELERRLQRKEMDRYQNVMKARKAMHYFDGEPSSLLSDESFLSNYMSDSSLEISGLRSLFGSASASSGDHFQLATEYGQRNSAMDSRAETSSVFTISDDEMDIVNSVEDIERAVRQQTEVEEQIADVEGAREDEARERELTELLENYQNLDALHTDDDDDESFEVSFHSCVNSFCSAVCSPGSAMSDPCNASHVPVTSISDEDDIERENGSSPDLDWSSFHSCSSSSNHQRTEGFSGSSSSSNHQRPEGFRGSSSSSDHQRPEGFRGSSSSSDHQRTEGFRSSSSSSDHQRTEGFHGSSSSSDHQRTEGNLNMLFHLPRFSCSITGPSIREDCDDGDYEDDDEEHECDEEHEVYEEHEDDEEHEHEEHEGDDFWNEEIDDSFQSSFESNPHDDEDSMADGLSYYALEMLPTHTYKSSTKQQPISNQFEGADWVECQVCLDKFTDGELIRTLPCCHQFHAKCIDVWLHKNDICPVCRLGVTAELFGA